MVTAEEQVQVAGGALVEEAATKGVVRAVISRGTGAGAADAFLEDEVGRPGQRRLIAGEVHSQVGRIEDRGRAALVFDPLEGPRIEALEIDKGVDRQAVEHVPLVGVRQAARRPPVGVVAGENVGEVARGVGEHLR